MQTTDTRRKIFLDLRDSYLTFAANATTEADKRKWKEKAEEAERTAYQKDQPKP